VTILSQSVLLLSLLAADGFQCGADGPQTPPAAKPKGKFTVGNDTTYVTGPLDKDGRIDYQTALNERLGKGVTPENNANVLIWKAVGPHPEGANMPAEFFKLLGVPQPPEQGDYFVPLARYVKETLNLPPGPAADAVFEQLTRATRRPWAAKDSPALDGWLTANEKPLAVAVEATKRTHYFSPLVSKGGLLGALLPAVQKCREVASALAARAMLRAESGAADAAWQDLQACHRLGRLVGRGGILIEALVGIAVDTVAFRADVAFLVQTKPSVQQIEKYMDDLRKLPRPAPPANIVVLGERFMLLENIFLADRHGINYLEGLSNGKPKNPNPLGEKVMEGIDWDPALKSANKWYDRMAAAMRQPDRAARVKALDQIDADLKDRKKQLTDGGELNRKLVGNAQERGQALGDVLVGLLLPAVSKIQTAADRGQQLQDNVLLAFALAA
jgi:hypothetical protein